MKYRLNSNRLVMICQVPPVSLSLASNWLMDEAHTKEADSKFQLFMTLMLKAFLWASDLALGYSSFHWHPLICLALFHVRNISGFTTVSLWSIW